MRRLSLWGACLWLLAACGGDVPDEVLQSVAQVQCPPAQQRSCACLGGTGLGVQVCLDSGEGFGECTGCPEPAPVTTGAILGLTGGTPATGGEAAPETGGMQSGGLLTGGTQTGGLLQTGGAEPTTGGVTSTGGGDSGGETLLDIAPEAGVPGTACGVALPVLCEADTEKCCMRSLQTDSCMPADGSCECDLPGCVVTQGYCDGPEDCPASQVCCGTIGGQTYTSFRCQSSCTDARVERSACHIGAGESPCPSGQICANSQLLSTVQICVNPATIQQ